MSARHRHEWPRQYLPDLAQPNVDVPDRGDRILGGQLVRDLVRRQGAIGQQPHDPRHLQRQRLHGPVPLVTAAESRLRSLGTLHARETPANDATSCSTSAAILPRRQALKHSVARVRHEDASELYDELLGTFGSLRPLRALLSEALRDTSVEITEDGDRFAIRVALASGRQQTVHVEINRDVETSEAIVRTFSICGRATDEYYERALQLNATISHGSVAIQTIDGAPFFVMVNAYPRATCDPEEIRKSVLEIARHSDEVEHLLSREDRY